MKFKLRELFKQFTSEYSVKLRRQLVIGTAAAVALSSVVPAGTIMAAEADPAAVETAAESPETTETAGTSNAAEAAEDGTDVQPVEQSAEVQAGSSAELTPQSAVIILAVNANKEVGDRSKFDEIVWTSSDENVVTVQSNFGDDGSVTITANGVQAGSAQITAATADGTLLETWNVTVSAAEDTAAAENESDIDAATVDEYTDIPEVPLNDPEAGSDTGTAGDSSSAGDNGSSAASETSDTTAAETSETTNSSETTGSEESETTEDAQAADSADAEQAADSEAAETDNTGEEAANAEETAETADGSETADAENTDGTAAETADPDDATDDSEAGGTAEAADTVDTAAAEEAAADTAEAASTEMTADETAAADTTAANADETAAAADTAEADTEQTAAADETAAGTTEAAATEATESSTEESSEELTYDEGIAKLYDESMTITDEEVLDVAENMSSDFTAIEENSSESDQTENVIGTVKAFEAEKAEYLAGSPDESDFTGDVEDELSKQKDYMNSYVATEDTVTEVVPKVSVSSSEIDGNTATADVDEWVTVGYDNGEGTGASAYGYSYTLELSKDEDTGVWSVTDVSNTDQNYDWLMTSDEMDDRLEEAGITLESSGDTSLDDIEAASTEEYLAAGDGSYNPDEAAAYADKWWNSSNSAFPSYVSRGVDCANFVSQCLYAGGLPQSSTWKPGKYAWVNVNGQIAYLKSFGTFTTATSSTVKKGNPVYYDWDSSGDYDHAAICVGTSGSTPIVDAHTSARYHVNYTLGAKKVATIQLNKSSISSGSSSSSSSNGWVKKNGSWYYYNGGSMKTGWQKVGGKWYYMNSSGVMQKGWQRIGGKWYYMNGSGAMLTGWQRLKWSGGTNWFYFNGSGAMKTGWQRLKWSGGTNWFYFNGSGAMKTGWQRIGGKWYYMNGSGAMKTGWQRISGKWYYMNGSGAMLTGWQRIGGKWYYFYSSGAMASNTYVGSYHVNSSGVWDR